jgi:hypothetical protein
MNPFQNNLDGDGVITQPFLNNPPEYNRHYSLRASLESRTSDRSSVTEYATLGTFQGTEPQQVQRVTTNLITVDEGVAMQVGAFLIYTDTSTLNISKGHILLDHKTEKNYKIISFYRTGAQHKLIVIELDD